jgi:hypothetical protein
MKPKNQLSVILIIFTLFSASKLMAQVPQIFGFNPKDAQLITIKNNSGDSANDFHLQVKVPLPGMGGIPVIKKVVFVPGAAGQNGAFRDTLFPPGSTPSGCDWGAAENNFMVPPGQGFRIQLWGNGYNKDSTYLTRNGTPLSTNGLKFRMEINKNTGGGNGNMKMVNEDNAGIVLQNVIMHINNSNFPFDSVNYSPTGTVVPGIPLSMLINPGDSVMYPYTGSLAGNWLTMHMIAAKVTSPGDYFEMGAAAFEENQAAIPTLTEWGLIVLAVLTLSFGIFYIVKMRG